MSKIKYYRDASGAIYHDKINPKKAVKELKKEVDKRLKYIISEEKYWLKARANRTRDKAEWLLANVKNVSDLVEIKKRPSQWLIEVCNMYIEINKDGGYYLVTPLLEIAKNCAKTKDKKAKYEYVKTLLRGVGYDDTALYANGCDQL
jgi:hypothetical protein